VFYVSTFQRKLANVLLTCPCPALLLPHTSTCACSALPVAKGECNSYWLNCSFAWEQITNLLCNFFRQKDLACCSCPVLFLSCVKAPQEFFWDLNFFCERFNRKSQCLHFCFSGFPDSGCESLAVLFEEGVLQSMHYPERYSNMAHCQWIICAPEDHVIKV